MENNNDFKYVLLDTGHVYFGKELTYQEIMEREDTPFKYKAIISSYVTKDTSLEQKQIDHILHMNKSGFTYQVFKQLKMEIKIFYKEEKKGIGAGKKEKWIHKSCPLAQFLTEYREAVLQGKVMVEDVSISKLALLVVSI